MAFAAAWLQRFSYQDFISSLSFFLRLKADGVVTTLFRRSLYIQEKEIQFSYFFIEEADSIKQLGYTFIKGVHYEKEQLGAW